MAIKKLKLIKPKKSFYKKCAHFFYTFKNNPEATLSLSLFLLVILSVIFYVLSTQQNK